jgi:CheY-like chemotaxis protein
MAQQPKLILIADNSPPVRRLLRAVLEKLITEPVGISEAADGFEALVLARRERPDLLLLAYRLPKLSGPMVCRVLRRQRATRRIKVLMLPPAEAGVPAPPEADAALARPFSPIELINTVRKLLG